MTTEHGSLQKAITSVMARLPGNVIGGVITAIVIYLLVLIGGWAFEGGIVRVLGGVTKEQMMSIESNMKSLGDKIESLDNIDIKELENVATRLQGLETELADNIQRLDMDDIGIYQDIEELRQLINRILEVVEN